MKNDFKLGRHIWSTGSDQCVYLENSNADIIGIALCNNIDNAISYGKIQVDGKVESIGSGKINQETKHEVDSCLTKLFS